MVASNRNLFVLLKRFNLMPERVAPSSYFNVPPNPYSLQPSMTETSVIPIWVPILISIALIGSFIVAIFALSTLKPPAKKEKEKDDESPE
jgi:hypothetical protein